MWEASNTGLQPKTMALPENPQPVQEKKEKCNFSESAFKNTFFENAHLDIETILVYVNAYLRESFCYTFVTSELGLASHSICDWASFCREVLVEWCLKREIVEIDESKFGKRK